MICSMSCKSGFRAKMSKNKHANKAYHLDCQLSLPLQDKTDEYIVINNGVQHGIFSLSNFISKKNVLVNHEKN